MKTHLIFPVGFASLIFSQTALSAPLFWDGTGTGWDSVANWSIGADVLTDPGAVPGAADVATFNTTALTTAQTVSLNANQSVLGLSFVSPETVTLQGGGANRTLQIGASGITTSSATTVANIGNGTNQNVNVSLMADQSWLFNGTNVANRGIFVKSGVSLGITGSHNLTLGGSSGSTSVSSISGVVSDGSGTLNIVMDSGNNTNRWNLTAANTYTGTTTISSGALGISNANALGALGAGSGTSVAAGAALFIRASIPSIAAETLSIAGNGSAGGGGALRSVSGSSTWNGTIAANATTANVAIGSDTGVFTLSNTADITVTGNNTLQLTNQSVTSTGALVVNGNISGTAGVSKITSPLSFVTFGGDAKDYSGATTVTTGTFTLNTSILNTSTVTVAAPGILRGDGGVINPLATTTIAGRIAPGATTSPGIGTMTMGALSLANASTTDIDIDSLTLGTDVLMTGNLNIDAGAILALNDLGAGSITSGALLFLKYSGIWNGGLFTVNGQVITDNGTIFSVGGNSYQLDYNYSGPLGSGVALLATVPEPATMSLAGLAGLVIGFRRRRVKSVG